MLLKRTTLTVALAISLSTCFSQSKKELQEFIISDLKKYAGTWLYTWDGKIDQKETNYNFSIQDCNLTITSRFSDDGITWGDAKVVIPITDINEVMLIEKEVRGTITMSNIISSPGYRFSPMQIAVNRQPQTFLPVWDTA